MGLTQRRAESPAVARARKAGLGKTGDQMRLEGRLIRTKHWVNGSVTSPRKIYIDERGAVRTSRHVHSTRL